jgi:ribosomal-protein-alanine N-acetyltransferase
MSIVIRPMRRQHLQEVLEIERQSFSTPWSSPSFLAEMENPHSIALVALKEEAVVGYICVRHTYDEGHILDLAVHPEHRRQGIGRRLVQAALSGLAQRGCLYVFLEVRASNVAAKRLYESLDFRVVGRRRNYYLAPLEDALVMMKELP